MRTAPELCKPLTTIHRNQVPTNSRHRSQQSHTKRPVQTSIPIRPHQRFHLIHLHRRRLHTHHNIPTCQRNHHHSSNSRPSSKHNEPLPRQSSTKVLPPSRAIPAIRLQRRHSTQTSQERMYRPLLSQRTLTILMSTYNTIRQLNHPRTNIRPRPPIQRPSNKR